MLRNRLRLDPPGLFRRSTVRPAVFYQRLRDLYPRNRPAASAPGQKSDQQQDQDQIQKCRNEQPERNRGRPGCFFCGSCQLQDADGGFLKQCCLLICPRAVRGQQIGLCPVRVEEIRTGFQAGCRTGRIRT